MVSKEPSSFTQGDNPSATEYGKIGRINAQDQADMAGLGKKQLLIVRQSALVVVHSNVYSEILASSPC